MNTLTSPMMVSVVNTSSATIQPAEESMEDTRPRTIAAPGEPGGRTCRRSAQCFAMVPES